MVAILKRELKAYFTSPVAYIYLAVFYLICGFYFIGGNITNGVTDLQYVFSGIFLFVIILLPLLTMKLFSDEKKQKTDQCLLTAPVSLFGIVMGKFLAAMFVFFVGTLIFVPFVLVIYSLAGTIAWATVICNYIALLLLGGAFISIGILISSLTEHQIIAAIVSIIVNFVLYMIDVFAAQVSNTVIRTVMVSVGFYNRYFEFTQGILNVTSIVFFVSVIFVFNFITVRVLEKRRWS